MEGRKRREGGRGRKGGGIRRRHMKVHNTKMNSLI